MVCQQVGCGDDGGDVLAAPLEGGVVVVAGHRVDDGPGQAPQSEEVGAHLGMGRAEHVPLDVRERLPGPRRELHGLEIGAREAGEEGQAPRVVQERGSRDLVGRRAIRGDDPRHPGGRAGVMLEPLQRRGGAGKHRRRGQRLEGRRDRAEQVRARGGGAPPGRRRRGGAPRRTGTPPAAPPGRPARRRRRRPRRRSGPSRRGRPEGRAWPRPSTGRRAGTRWSRARRGGGDREAGPGPRRRRRAPGGATRPRRASIR